MASQSLEPCLIVKSSTEAIQVSGGTIKVGNRFLFFSNESVSLP